MAVCGMLLVVSLALSASAQTSEEPVASNTATKATWTSADFPNPQVDYSSCGLSQPGCVCDPGNVLTQYERDDLSAIIERIHDYASCDCPDCSVTKLPSAQILPAVAVIPDITGSHYPSPEEFAALLREERWKYGGCCDNDFVLALDVKEKRVGVSVGSKAEDVGMEPECVGDVLDDHQQYFTNVEYGEGLLLVMDDFRKLLSDHKQCGGAGLSTGAIAGISVGTISVLIILIILYCCCCRRERERVTEW